MATALNKHILWFDFGKKKELFGPEAYFVLFIKEINVYLMFRIYVCCKIVLRIDNAMVWSIQCLGFRIDSDRTVTVCLIHFLNYQIVFVLFFEP